MLIIAVMASGLHVVRAGAGPRILLIHGSATDRGTWVIQLSSPLRDHFTLIAYDRRADALTIEAHADDAAELLAAEPGPAVVIGSSFGAVVALEVVRRHAARVAGAILIEPPIAASDTADVLPAKFLDAFDRRAARDGGPAAAELFLRTVLGDAELERMPRMFQVRAMQKFVEIRADTVALGAYRPRYAELAGLRTPVLLLGGGRSSPVFRPTLEALHGALGNARLEIIASAGHMLHAEAPRRFHDLVAAFARQALGELAPP
jgi:pimeloyl-ACP methyl ester carboxylesterase